MEEGLFLPLTNERPSSLSALDAVRIRRIKTYEKEVTHRWWMLSVIEWLANQRIELSRTQGYVEITYRELRKEKEKVVQQRCNPPEKVAIRTLGPHGCRNGEYLKTYGRRGRTLE